MQRQTFSVNKKTILFGGNDMSIIIEKNGKKVMELCVLDLGQCAIKRNVNNSCCYTIISAEKFASILDRADDNGCDIFDYCF